MKKSKKLFILTALTVMAVSTSNLSGMQGGFKDNLYEKIKYRNMFDQTDICADPRYRKSFENEGHDMKKLLEKPEYDSDGKEGLFKKMFHALTCDLFWNCMEKEEAPGKKDDDYFEQSEQALKEHSGETLVQIDYTSEYLDKILVREFRRRKRKYMRKAAFPVFGTCAFDVSTFLCGSRLMQRNEEKDDSDEKGNQNFGSSFAMLIGIDIIRRNVKDFTKAFVEYVSPSDDLDEFEELYAKRKRFLNKNLQDKVEDKFANARKDPKNLDKTKEFLRIALNIPIKDKKLNFTRETIEKIIKFAD